jgi:hypothetical protein
MRDVALSFARVGAVENRNEVFGEPSRDQAWRARVIGLIAISTAIGNF